MALVDISYFYEEQEKTSTRLFLTLSQGKNKLTPANLKLSLKQLKLNPSPEELQDIFTEILQTSNASEINENTFRQMRLSPPGTFMYESILNIIAEYIKFNVAYIHRGFITEDAIETALERDGSTEEFVEKVKSQMLKLVFNEEYKILGIKELYCFMRGIIPNQWREWVCDCLFENYEEKEICEEMVERGFDERIVTETVASLAENGFTSALPEFLDKCPLNVTHCYI